MILFCFVFLIFNYIPRDQPVFPAIWAGACTQAGIIKCVDSGPSLVTLALNETSDLKTCTQQVILQNLLS